MKLLILFTFVYTSCFAQKQTYTIGQLVPIDSVSGDIVYQGVVEVPNVSASDLYSRAKTFYFKTFNNANTVIQADEKDKRVGGKGILKIPTSRKVGLLASPPGDYNITIEILVKDGRYRYELSQFSINNAALGVYNGMPLMTLYKKSYPIKGMNERAADSVRLFDESLRSVVATLEQYMTGKVGNKDF